MIDLMTSLWSCPFAEGYEFHHRIHGLAFHFAEGRLQLHVKQEILRSVGFSHPLLNFNLRGSAKELVSGQCSAETRNRGV